MYRFQYQQPLRPLNIYEVQQGNRQYHRLDPQLVQESLFKIACFKEHQLPIQLPQRWWKG